MPSFSSLIVSTLASVLLLLATTSLSGAQQLQPTDEPATSQLPTNSGGTACDWSSAESDCPAFTSCVPLPSDISQGVCVANPADGALLPTSFGKPVFHFPLTNGSLSSWPFGGRSGVSLQGEAAWANSSTGSRGPNYFPSALRCGGDGMHVHIDNLPYGRRGAFALNFWMRSPEEAAAAPRGGQQFQYVLSHATAEATQPDTPFSAFDQNQVNVYLHAAGRPLYGVVRAAVKDSNDDEDEVFLDSDGLESNTITLRAPLPSGMPANVTDGAWHMITLTTHPDGTRGYGLFVDGKLAATLPSFSGNATEADGGDLMLLDGPLSLCNRADGDPRRSYNGYLAQLTVVDAALTAEDVQALFDIIAKPAEQREAQEGPITQPTLFDSTSQSWPDLSAEELASEEAAAVPEESSNSTTQPVSYDLPEGSICTLDLALPVHLFFCAPGLVCVPRRLTAPDQQAPASARFPPGVCSKPQQGVLLPEAFPPSFPWPLAYFPLSTPAIASYPDGAYRQREGSSQSSTAPDTRFGSVLQCGKEQDNGTRFVQLDPVPYANKGSFAINLFFKASRKDLLPSLFSYLFSHVGANETDMTSGPNKIHLFVPGQRSAFYGVSLRAIMRDRVDKDQGRSSEVWLDSSGHVGVDLSGTLLEDGVVVDDGEWHMVTLTTLPKRARSRTSPAVTNSAGHALYLDGVLRAVLKPGVKRSTRNESDTAVQITGGAPADLTGPITLCGRADLSRERFFTGQLSNMMLFDTALEEEQVAHLYAAYSQQAITYPVGDVTPASNHTTQSGDACALPFSLGGHLYFSPIFIQGVLSCPTQDNNSWAPAAKPASLAAEDLNLTSYGVADGSSAVGTAQLPRLTLSGQTCILPFRHTDGNTYADCIQQTDGTAKCPVAGNGDTLQECAPIIQIPPNKTQCIAPSIKKAQRTSSAARGSSSTEAFVECVSIKGSEHCKTQPQSWISCPPVAAQRKTITGVPCQIPFESKGVVHSDCIIDAKYQFASVCPISPDEEQGMYECEPTYTPAPVPKLTTRYTLDRQECVPPNPGALSECLDYDDSGVPKCQTASGALMACAPVLRVGVSGTPCAFPFVYNHRNRTNCVSVDGVEGCKTVEGHWEQCAGLYATSFPRPPVNATGRFTVTGKTCAAPFEYKGEPTWDCVKAGSIVDGYCTTVSGDWEQCAPVRTNISRTNTVGEQCVLPFKFGGALYYDCVASDPATGNPGFCMNNEGKMTLCGPRPNRYTTSGKLCTFGTGRWNGRNVTDCVYGPVSPFIAACPTANGTFEACAPLYVQPSALPSSSAPPPSPSQQPQADPDTLQPFGASTSTSSEDDAAASAMAHREHKKNKQKNLALGLTLGIGGGVLLIAIVLGALRRVWAKHHHQRVLRELRMPGTAGVELNATRPPPADSAGKKTKTRDSNHPAHNKDHQQEVQAVTMQPLQGTRL